jgi:hypothetical protein
MIVAFYNNIALELTIKLIPVSMGNAKFIVLIMTQESGLQQQHHHHH